MLRVRDIWLALHITRWWFKNCIAISVFAVAVASLYIVLTSDPQTEFVSRILMVLFITIIATLLTTVVVFVNYNKGILISLSESQVSWPASDIENSLFDILILKKFWRHLFRETVGLQSIQDIRNDTVGRGHDDRFRLNISGEFGSRQIEFSSKQKRDECRTRLLGAIRQCGFRAFSDPNFLESAEA